MKPISSKCIAQLLIATALVSLGSSVLAASTWTYSGGPGTGSCASTASSGVAAGNTLGCGTLAGVMMDAKAFSTSNGASSSSGTTFAAAALYNWSGGLGAVNGFESPSATGPHATDNRFGTDAILLHFTDAVSLINVGIGWSGTSHTVSGLSGNQDSDFSVLAYTGSATGSSTIIGKTLNGTPSSTLLTTGWQAVGNYANQADNSNVAISSTLYSSYWLISAYNGAFGPGAGLGAGNDYFKLASVTALAQTNVPEPGSIALVGLGLVGLVAARRRTQKAA